MKTVFRLHSGVNEGQHHQQQQHQKISTNKNNKILTNSHQKVFRNMHRKRPVLNSLFNKVSGLQPAAFSIKRLQVFYCEIIKSTFFYRTSPDDCFWKITIFY